MYNRNSKLAVSLAIIFEILLFFTLKKELYLSILAIICILLPFFITHIANNKKIKLPYNFQLIIVLFVFAALYLGEIFDFYDRFWWWDLMLHIIFGIYVVIIVFFIMDGIIKQDNESSYKRFLIFISILAFSFSLAFGTLWEIFEFLGDYFFKTKMVKGGLEDSLTDLIAKAAAAFITSVIYYFYNKKNEK